MSQKSEKKPAKEEIKPAVKGSLMGKRKPLGGLGGGLNSLKRKKI